MADLRGRCALVTGGARGIGAAIVHRLDAAGARVLAVDLRDAELEALTRAMTGRVECLAADVRDLDRLRAWLESRDTWPDVLVNNAAVAPRRPVLELDRETLETVLDVNLVSPLLTRLVAERLLDQGRPGAVVNVASVNAYRGHSGPAPLQRREGGAAVGHPDVVHRARTAGDPGQRGLSRFDVDGDLARGRLHRGRPRALRAVEPARAVRGARRDRARGRVPRLHRCVVRQRGRDRGRRGPDQ